MATHICDLNDFYSGSAGDAGVVEALCKYVRSNHFLGVDMEWNCSEVTGTGTESGVMTVQICYLDAYSTEVGTNVEETKVNAARAKNCTTNAEVYQLVEDLHDAWDHDSEIELVSTLTPELAMALAMMLRKRQRTPPDGDLTEDGVFGGVIVFRLADSASSSPTKVMPELPEPFVALMNDPSITWVGANIKGDFARLAKYEGIDGHGSRKYLNLCSPGLLHTGRKEVKLGAIAKMEPLKTDVYKSIGHGDVDWSIDKLVNHWVTYAASDAVLVLLAHFGLEGETPDLAVDIGGAATTQPAGISKGASDPDVRKLIFDDLLEATSDEPPLGNRSKKDWNHQYRGILSCICKEHPARSVFAPVKLLIER
jgi:hypothetical protein